MYKINIAVLHMHASLEVGMVKQTFINKSLPNPAHTKACPSRDIFLGGLYARALFLFFHVIFADLHCLSPQLDHGALTRASLPQTMPVHRHTMPNRLARWEDIQPFPVGNRWRTLSLWQQSVNSFRDGHGSRSVMMSGGTWHNRWGEGG